MRNFHSSIILICICVWCSYRAEASHIVGADMSYKNIGANTFEFTLNIYRDCAGIPVQPTYEIDYASLNCNIQGHFVVSVIPSLTREVSPVCPGIPTLCTGGTQNGIQQYVFRGTVTLPQACTDWTFSFRTCNRNKAITTVVNPGAQCIYIESTLNNVAAPTNSSPTFNNPPVSILCTNQVNSFNPGAAEIDGDVMTFSSVTPKTGKGQDIVYMPPFSSGNPLSTATGYKVDPQFGDIIVNPTVINQVTSVAVKTEEYRNGVLIGSVTRDIQIITKDCNNNNPVLSGIDKSNTDTKTICAGNELCFNVYGSDVDPNQTLTMTWDYAIDTTYAKFKVSGDSIAPKGSFCWNTQPSDSGLYFFTVTLKDNFCPIQGTTTKSYKINVTPSPKIILPAVTNIACNTTTTLTPSVTGGIAPYNYKWNTGDVTPSITKGAGTYTLFVTDKKNCKSSATAKISSGVIADFTFTKVCSTRTVNFIDQSTSLVGTVNNWAWDFGEPSSSSNTSSAQNPSHTYAAGGDYPVTLTIKDNTGCTETIVKKVRVCGIPQPDFTVSGHCQGNDFFITDNTKPDICGLIDITFQFGSVGGHYSHPPGPIYFPPGIGFDVIPNDTGWINLSYTVTNEDHCVVTVNKLIHIDAQPQISIVEPDYYFDCSNPNKTIHAVVNPAYGKAPFNVYWSNGSIGLTTTVSSPGIYVVYIVDANGCVNKAGISVNDPIKPAFINLPYCELTDPVKFVESSFAYWGANKWQWDFGDGTSFTTTDPTQRNPTHVYASQGVYSVKLTVFDVKGCQNFAAQDFVFILPDDHFVVDPSPFCIGQTLKFESPRGLYIDSLLWTFDNGDTIAKNKAGFLQYPIVQNPPVPVQYYYFDSTYTYPPSAVGNTYHVKLKMFFNNKTCVRNYSKNITIFPAFKADIDSMKGKQCKGDSLQFYASEKTSTGVTSWKWIFKLQDNAFPYNKVAIDSSTLQNPKMSFSKDGNYFATLIATNGNGCQEITSDYYFQVVYLPPPQVCPDKRCATQKTVFLYFCGLFPEVAIDSVHWNFGDGTGVDVQEPFHIYADSGTYNVVCEVFNTSFGCYAKDSLLTKIYLLPTPSYTAGPTCLGQTMYFKDQSIPSPGDSIVKWSWTFGDGNTFSTTDTSYRSPTHAYAATGDYQTSLQIESTKSHCTDTIYKTVSVNPNPKAGFSPSENELVSNRPILFADQSMGGVKWLWDFGDGTDKVTITDPLNSSPQHTYSGSVKKYTVTQIVYNQFGCTDTLRSNFDLSIHLLLPNAFSPNGDGNNENFNLVYKGIESLEQFVIFNRWGEKIFDAGGNLDTGWDGTYKGTNQPLGVYVYYVKAKTYEGEEMAISGKVTLIR